MLKPEDTSAFRYVDSIRCCAPTRAEIPGIVGAPETLGEIAPDLPTRGPIGLHAQACVGRRKAGVGDQEREPAAGLEDPRHSVKRRIQSRDVHQGEAAHDTVEVSIRDGAERLSVIHPVADAERVCRFLAPGRLNQLR